MAVPNQKLEAARMHRRWSVAMASEKAGVSINTFNRWERGLQIPQLGTLDLLCKAFELSPEALGFGQAVLPKRYTPISDQEQLSSPTVVATHLQPSPVVSIAPPIPAERYMALNAMYPYDVHACFEQVRRSLESMSQVRNKVDGDDGKGVSRRQAIATLISAPAMVLELAQNGQPTLLHPEEILSLCTVGIPLAWQLYFEGGLAEVEQILPGYLSQLTTLVLQSSSYQKRVAALLSQGYQLSSLLALQRQNFGSAHQYAQKGFEYGELAVNTHLQTASLIRQAQVHLYMSRPNQRLLAYERGLQYSETITPLLLGRLYIGLAEVHGQLGNEREAQQYLALAHTTFPEQYEADPNFAYTHFNNWSISSFEGLMYLHLGKPREAWELFAQNDKIVPKAFVPNRLELSVRQAATAYALGECDQGCLYVETALTAAKSMGNQLRCDETFKLYERMRAKWSDERHVKGLAHMFFS